VTGTVITGKHRMLRPTQGAQPDSRIYCFKEPTRVAAPLEWHPERAVSPLEICTIVNLTCSQINVATPDTKPRDYTLTGLVTHLAHDHRRTRPHPAVYSLIVAAVPQSHCCRWRGPEIWLIGASTNAFHVLSALFPLAPAKKRSMHSAPVAAYPDNKTRVSK
jgi:hypothetical protein